MSFTFHSLTHNNHTQIIIQLGRFNKQVLRMMSDREDERAAVAAATAAAERRAGGRSSSKVC